MDFRCQYKSARYFGGQYFLTILDDHSRNYMDLFDQNKRSIEAQYETYIKQIRTDNGIEFLQKACVNLFASKGIILRNQLIIVERKHMHLVEISRALRVHADLPIRLPFVILGWDTPYVRLCGHEPKYDHVRVLGCQCFVLIRELPMISLAQRNTSVCLLVILMAKRHKSCLIEKAGKHS
ncbi:hypothetical protein V2J09_017773 [Rumex salicifolius]